MRLFVSSGLSFTLTPQTVASLHPVEEAGVFSGGRLPAPFVLETHNLPLSTRQVIARPLSVPLVFRKMVYRYRIRK